MTKCSLSGLTISSPKPLLFIKDMSLASMSVATGLTSIPSSSKAATFYIAFEHAKVFVDKEFFVLTSATAST